MKTDLITLSKRSALKKMNLVLRSCIFLAALLPGAPALAQHDFSLYQMPVAQQASYVNPAATPLHKINIYLLPLPLPSVAGGVSNSGFALHDLYRPQGDSLRIDMGDALARLKQRNVLAASLQADLFAFGLRLGKNYFSANVTEKASMRFVYPKDMLQLLWEGNGGSLLGRRASFDGTGLYLTHYREYGVGFARELFSGFTAGAKVKYLKGYENIHTRNANFGLTTDAESFYLTADGSAEIRTSGVDSASFANVNSPADYLRGRANSGLGIDLGARWRVMERLELSASLVDIGYIKWKDNINNYKQDDFKFSFKGLRISDLLNDNDSAGSPGDALQDTLEKVFVLNRNNDAYSTALPGRFYLGGRLQLNRNFHTGLLLYGEMVHGKVIPGMCISANARVKRWLFATVNYNVYNRSYANIGAGFTANLGPVQLFVMSDNVLGLFNVAAMRNFPIRIGSNFVFGRKKDEAELF